MASRSCASAHATLQGDAVRNLIDLSINEMLAHSLYTSATALLGPLPVASFAIQPILLFLGEWRGGRRSRALNHRH